jgi:hypothetical protein
MGIGFSLQPTQRLEMTMLQRHMLIQTHILTMRLELILAIIGIRYRPEAKCPKCGREMTPLEILKGFNPDPNDLTTACTACHCRFAPKLVWVGQAGRVEMPFYCDMQTQARMVGLENLSPDELRKQHPVVYHSAIAHHGLLKSAFAVMGVDYRFNEVADTKLKIVPFLGKIPDAIIAELSGFKLATVRRMRRAARISACTQRAMLEEAQEVDPTGGA